ncbi:MAG: hypothetical protein AB1416_08945, partial [Actinomycetota bacterium]
GTPEGVSGGRGGTRPGDRGDLPFQRREWMAQRVAWVVMSLVAVAAVLGAFANGLLSRMTAGDGDTLRGAYSRIVRAQASTSIRVTVAPALTAGGAARVWLSRD